MFGLFRRRRVGAQARLPCEYLSYASREQTTKEHFRLVLQDCEWQKDCKGSFNLEFSRILVK